MTSARHRLLECSLSPDYVPTCLWVRQSDALRILDDKDAELREIREAQAAKDKAEDAYYELQRKFKSWESYGRSVGDVDEVESDALCAVMREARARLRKAIDA